MKLINRCAKLKPGMVFTIPRRSGGFYLIIHLASNRFGEAFGLTDGWQSENVVPATLRPHLRQAIVHTGSEFVVSGRWRHVGDRPDLLTVYPPEPEIYHQKADNPDNPSIGPYGAAETASSQLRNLSEAEYRASPLVQSDYRQVMLEEQVEDWLHCWENGK